MNWSDRHVLLKWKDRNRRRELHKDIRRHVPAHAGKLQFRFQHGPFTKRFDLQSLWSANVLVNLLLLLHSGHCQWDWTSTWLEQATDQRLYRLTERNNSVCEVLQRVYRPAGCSHMLETRTCVYTSVGHSGSLNETCNKDEGYCTKIYCRCTSYKPAH